MVDPFYFTVRALQVGFIITPGSHHINQAISKNIIKPNYPEFGNDVPYIIKIFKQMASIYARLINQYKFNYKTVISARFDKQDEDNQVLDETELFINLKTSHKLTESDNDNFDNKSPLEQQFQNQEMKSSGLKFDSKILMTI